MSKEGNNKVKEEEEGKGERKGINKKTGKETLLIDKVIL